MNEQEQKDHFNAAAIQTLKAQRDAALDGVVNLQAQMAVMQQMLAARDAEIARLATDPAASV